MMKYNSYRGLAPGVAGLALVFLLLVGGFSTAYHSSQRDLQFEVQGVERVVKEDGGYYIVFTDHGPFANKDSLIFRKFRSSDVQNEFYQGSTCEATVAGWRVPVLSVYPNVIDANCAEST